MVTPIEDKQFASLLVNGHRPFVLSFDCDRKWFGQANPLLVLPTL